MWMYQALTALELANERAREMQLAAARDRMALEAGGFADRPEPPRRSRVRTIVAAPVRAFSDATHVLSDAACTAATRIEGRTA